ncbi:MAG: M18 family aminopeptidase, partial [Ilumatobacteraceae bacterium]
IYASSRGYVIRQGSVIAWSMPPHTLINGIRIIGAHTDSPGLHIKPQPDISSNSWRQLAVEVYGSPLLNSWLDRDLGVAGHAVLRDGKVIDFNHHSPIARIPQLAIHLDREVNERGLVLDRQQHLVPVWATTPGQTFRSWVADTCAVNHDEIVAIHAQLFDTQPSAIIGLDDTLLASARLDNQISCWAAVEALLQANDENPSVVVLFDHEEVGSQSAVGAAGPLLEHALERIALNDGLDRAGFLDMLRRSHCVSADNAHAVHPNYFERHDPQHLPIVNGGPVIKLNSNQRYATSAHAVAPFLSACSAMQIPTQTFVSRNNIPCGSTIGPITATRLGIDTIDVGVAQLSMHSIREMCGVHDPAMLMTALTAYLDRR